MNRKRLLTFPPCPVPANYEAEYNPEDVIAASQVLQREDGEPVLEIDLFYAGELRARYFADREKKNYAVMMIEGGWKQNRLNTAAKEIKGMNTRYDCYYYGREYEWCDKEHADLVTKTLCTSVNYFEDSVICKKRTKAEERKQERLNQLVGEIHCVPDEAERWAEETFFPEQFLFVQKPEKVYQYACTACGGNGERKKAWKDNERTVCPDCGASVQVKRRLQHIHRTVPITILLKMNKLTWAERLFKVTCSWSSSGKELVWNTNICAIIPIGKTWGNVYYGLDRNADEFSQDWWDTNPEQCRWCESYLWPGSLKEVLPMGNLQRSGMDILAQKGQKFEANRYITGFHGYEYLEYIVKSGLHQLAADIVNPRYPISAEVNARAKDLSGLLGVNGNRLNRLKQMNGSISALRWLQYEEYTGKKISQESLEWLAEKKTSPNQFGTILRAVGSVNRMVNYAKKQKMAGSKLETYWTDYLRMAAEEGMDDQDDIVRFPKDLKARHDELVKLKNERADKEKLEANKRKYDRLDKEIQDRLPQAKKYFYEDRNYMIIPAGKCEELMAEGRTLHHCVGSSDRYMEKMAKGESWICFLRKKSDLQKPYYTLEIDMKNDRILQWYSEFDRKPDEEVIRKVLDKFKNSVKRKAEKPAAATE